MSPAHVTLLLALEYSVARDRACARACATTQRDCAMRARHHCLHTLMDSRDSHAGFVDRHIVDCASQRRRAAGTPPSLLRSHHIPAPKASLMGWLSERASLKLLEAVEPLTTAKQRPRQNDDLEIRPFETRLRFLCTAANHISWRWLMRAGMHAMWETCARWAVVCVHGTRLLEHAGGVLLSTKLAEILFSEH